MIKKVNWALRTLFCAVFAVCEYRSWLVLGLTKVDVMGVGTENELQIQEGVTKFIITSYDTVNNDVMTRILQKTWEFSSTKQ